MSTKLGNADVETIFFTIDCKMISKGYIQIIIK